MMDELSDEQKAVLARLAEEATPGPWYCRTGNNGIYSASGSNVFVAASPVKAEDMWYIRAAHPVAISALLAEIAELRELLIDLHLQLEGAWKAGNLPSSVIDADLVRRVIYSLNKDAAE